MEKDGEVLYEIAVEGEKEEGLTDRNLLNMKDILDFAETVDIEDVREVIGRQIRYNTAIAQEGLKGNYGANIGSVLLEMEGDNIRVRAKAMAAAGSDARMNGCELPVIINSGSGNQGMTCSLPVVEYAKGTGNLRSSSFALFAFPTWLPRIRNVISVLFPPTAALSVRLPEQGQASPICAAVHRNKLKIQ